MAQETPAHNGQGGRPHPYEQPPLDRSKLAGGEQNSDNLEPRESPYRGTISMADVERCREEKALTALTPVERFESAVCNARNQWSIKQARKGLASNRRIGKGEADRLLARAFAALAEQDGDERPVNSLAGGAK